MTHYYKAVDATGLSFFPMIKADRVNWIDLIGTIHALGDEEGWLEAIEKLKEGETTVCTKHLIHGYADIALAVDFGERQAKGRKEETFRIVEFAGEFVAELQGAMLLKTMEWDKERKERFVDAVKYGFRSVDVLREVPAEEWAV